MRFSISSSRRSAFTLVEIMIAGTLFAMVGGIAYFITNAGTVLYARNYSINASGASLRSGIDRINAEVSQATDLPQLITLGTGGSFTTATLPANPTATLGPAAGIVFDKYFGGPYIMTSSGAATATTFTVARSINALVTAPIPLLNDVLQIDGSPVRSRVSTATAGSVSNGIQPVSVNLASGSTTGTAWLAAESKPCNLIRKVAVIVVGNELRFYPAMEGVTNYTTAQYSVLSRDIGTSTGEATPFSLIIKNTRPFLSMSFRVQNRDYNNVLAKKESKEMNTSLRIDTLIRPRNATY